MALPSAVEALDLGDVFRFLLYDIGTCCSGVMAATLSSAASAPRTSLVVLVLLAILALVGGRLMVLATR